MKRDSETISVDITAEDMMNKYKRWKETTTTSSSGRHLGHFHALFRGFKFDIDEEYEELVQMRTEIIELHWLILRIAIRNRHVYKRWKKVVTQMIEKDPGNPKLFRLRVIHLYGCDFNLLLGLYFRLLQQHCEDRNSLNKGSYSGRPNRRAIDPFLVDVMQMEIAMVTRRPLIRFNNDLQQ